MFYCVESGGRYWRFATFAEQSAKVDELHRSGRLADTWVERERTRASS